eukprot:6071442-Pyramimonas_sp.AAC.1
MAFTYNIHAGAARPLLLSFRRDTSRGAPMAMALVACSSLGSSPPAFMCSERHSERYPSTRTRSRKTSLMSTLRLICAKSRSTTIFVIKACRPNKRNAFQNAESFSISSGSRQSALSLAASFGSRQHSSTKKNSFTAALSSPRGAVSASRNNRKG